MTTAKKTSSKSAGTKAAGKKAPAKKAGAASKSASARKAPAKKPAVAKSASHAKDDNYTKPELRERLKEEVKAGAKGGKPGQWSARKAQLLVHEYEAEGGGYKHPRNETQQHLKDWGDEKWHTADGKPAIRDGETHRYLPDKAWSKLSAAQKKATDKKKVEGSKKGKQFVANTAEASEARRESEK